MVIAEPQRCAHGKTVFESCDDCVEEELEQREADMHPDEEDALDDRADYFPSESEYRAMTT